jgi:threonine synthase
MVTVQASGCAPIVKAWDEQKATAEAWANAATVAAGLRVPRAYGDYLILDILRKSQGAAVAASDEEIMEAVQHWAGKEGVFAAPEGAAALVAYRKLVASGFFKSSDTVVLYNTGSGLKYVEAIAQYTEREPARPAARQIGGIIGPY